MKLIHLSDLHLGKRVHEFSMAEDQKYILEQILQIIENEQPGGILMAGDIYDKSIPSVEAVEILDEFLVSLSRKKLPVFIISGNHDSAERLAFASRIMKESNVYVSPAYQGTTEPVSLTDEWGKVNLYLLPFFKSAQARAVFPELEIATYTDAVATAIDQMDIDPAERNLLVAHQFVTGAVRCESEELTAGGTDNVDAQVFAPFDYVALGHLHNPQSAGRDTIRYCGTPLKYSFSEAAHQKSVTIIELREKGDITIRTADLTPRRDMKKIKGSYMELTARSFYQDLNQDDYFHITLTDEEDVPEAIGRLRAVYPNLMRLEYDNKRSRGAGSFTVENSMERKSPMELFADLYKSQNNQALSREQDQYLCRLMETIWEEEQ